MNQDHEQTGEPSFKRRRIALACTSCRNRKTRCNGGKPSCNLCVELGFNCVYEQPVKSSDTGPDGRSIASHDERLRAIEETLQMLVRRDRARENSHEQRQHGNSSHRAVPETARFDTTLSDDASVHEDGEGPMDGMATINDPEEADAAFYGLSSNISFIREISSATTARLKELATKNSAAQKQNGNGHPLLSAAQSPQPLISSTQLASKSPVDVHVLPPSKHAVELIKLFFNDTGLLYPYIYEQHVLRSFHTARLRGFAGIPRPFLALLNVIFAFATYITEHPDQSWEQNAPAAQVFFSRAQTLCRAPCTASMDTVHALLLMCQYRQGTQGASDAYMFHGLASRLAMQLGLHSKSACASLSPLDAEIRKRTWFACVYIDSSLAMTFGRPLTIPETYTSFELPLDCSLESLDSWTSPVQEAISSSESGVCLLKASIQLNKTLNDVLDRMYGSNLEPTFSLSLPEMLERLMGLEAQLQTLRKALPSSLLLRPWLQDNGEQSVSSRLSVIFRLRWLNVRILLHRPILVASLHYVINSEHHAVDTDTLFHGLAIRSIETCHQSACETIQIVSVMAKQSPRLLGAPWFSVYFAFNAALAIFACLVVGIDRTSFDSSESVDALSKTIVAVEKIGGGAKPAKMVSRTLRKLIRTSTALIQAREAKTGDVAAANGSQQARADRSAPEAIIFDGDGCDDLVSTWTEADWDLFSDMAALSADIGDFAPA